MNPINPSAPAQGGPAFRVHQNLVLEICSEGISAKIKLSPTDALAIIQSLIFDIREDLFRAQAEMAQQRPAQQ